MKKIYKILSLPLYSSIILILIIILLEKFKSNIIFIFTIVLISALLSILISIIKKKKKFLIKVLFYHFILLLFLIRIFFIEENYQKALEQINNSRAVIGTIVNYPKLKKNKQEFKLKVQWIKFSNTQNYVKIKPFNILIKINKNNMNLRRGDIININKKIILPRDKINNFKYKEYLYYHKIYGKINVEESKIKNLNHKIEIPFFNKLLRFSIWDLRNKILKKLKNNLSQKSYSFILSVFFGIKTEMDKSIYNKFKNTGMIHLLAISGLHIGFIGLIFYKLANAFLSKSKSLIFSLLILLIYIIIISPSASSLRAFIMYLLASIFFIFGINISILIILIFTFIILCFINPYYIFDIGFQFSFLATIGIILLSNNIKENIPMKIPEKIKNIISVTVSAFLSIFMLQWALFKKVPFFSILSSVIIVPLFGIIFSVLFFLVILFCISNLFFIPKIIEFIISIFLKIIDILDKIPAIKLPEIPVFLSYLFLPLIIIFFYIIYPNLKNLLKKLKYKKLYY